MLCPATPPSTFSPSSPPTRSRGQHAHPRQQEGRVWPCALTLLPLAPLKRCRALFSFCCHLKRSKPNTAAAWRPLVSSTARGCHHADIQRDHSRTRGNRPRRCLFPFLCPNRSTSILPRQPARLALEAPWRFACSWTTVVRCRAGTHVPSRLLLALPPCTQEESGQPRHPPERRPAFSSPRCGRGCAGARRARRAVPVSLAGPCWWPAAALDARPHLAWPTHQPGRAAFSIPTHTFPPRAVSLFTVLPRPRGCRCKHFVQRVRAVDAAPWLRSARLE